MLIGSRSYLLGRLAQTRNAIHVVSNGCFVDFGLLRLIICRKSIYQLCRRSPSGLSDADELSAGIRKIVSSFKEFDIILCTWVFSHINKPDNLVGNFNKSIKNGGKIYLIFLSEPKWYMRLLFYPIGKIFKTRYTKEDEIKRFGNIVKRNSYFANLITTLEIRK